MSDNKNKFLVTLDGSKNSLKTVDYLCRFKPFLGKELVLCTIISKVPEYYYDLKKDPFSSSAASRVRAWELGYQAEMKAFMERARMKLIASGFKPEAIETKILVRNKGIARDILTESKDGYEALVLRRRSGKKAFLPIILGSVSTKLVEKATRVPVILAGTQPVTHSLLVGIDGSEGSKRAVKFTADFIKGYDCRVVLCSVLREFDFSARKVSSHKVPDHIREAYQRIEDDTFQAEKIFNDAGLASKNIVTKIIQGADSRAGSIIEAVFEENCDTVVFGRRGKSEASEFDIGRIPWKVIHGARQLSVWVVP